MAALKGQDFLVITLSVSAPRDTQRKLFRAAAAAGITYVMPNAYGNDPYNFELMDEMMFGDGIRGALSGMKEFNLRPIIIACGFWFEFSLGGGTERYGFDFAKREFIIFDEGNVKTSTSTWPQCGRAVAALLSLPILPTDENDKAVTLDSYVGRSAYVHSFTVSQKDMFESVKRVTGTTDADWKITTENSRERYNTALQNLAKGDIRSFAVQMYTRIFFPSSDGDHSDKLDNDVLGLPQEDLDEWTAVAVQIGLTGATDEYAKKDNKRAPTVG